MINIRGLDFQENTNNEMGLEFYNLSHRFGFPFFKSAVMHLSALFDDWGRGKNSGDPNWITLYEIELPQKPSNFCQSSSFAQNFILVSKRE